MSYIGAEPTTAAFPFDQFSGTGAATSFTLTYAPASATSILVAISGVMQNPNLYSVIGTTLSFSPAPPAGTNNISVLYLGLPVIGSSSPGNTAFLSATDLTATAGQTVFASAGSYTPGFVQVYRNGARLGNADFTATNGTTITLAVGAAAGDLVTIEYYTLTSLVNALPLTGGTVTGSTTFNSTVSVNGAAVSGFTGMKNRIINGNMVVNQRATSVTASAYTVDRFEYVGSQSSKATISQDTSVYPTGFNASLKVLSSSAYTVGASEIFMVRQPIEGSNMADFAWGTASAATVTLSFWARSSLTGTFGGAFENSAIDRCYVFSYTVSAANTWEYKTVTIAGDTNGTWLTTTGIGMRVSFSLGAGSSFSAPAGSWGTTRLFAPTGSVSVVGTSGATFYITGVQLERGSNATSFEFVDYGRQLIQCQRYFFKTAATTTYGYPGFDGYCVAGYFAAQSSPFPVQMRAAPTGSIAGTWAQSGCSGLGIVATDINGFFMAAVGSTTGMIYWHSNSSGTASFSAEF